MHEDRTRDLPARPGGFGMNPLAHVGDVLAMNARLIPDKIGARDLERAMTFRQWNERACRLANALIGIGLVEGRSRLRPRLQLPRVAGNLRGHGDGRAGRGADQLPAGRAGNPLHRRKLRSARLDRPGRIARARSRPCARICRSRATTSSCSAASVARRLPRLRGADRRWRATASRTCRSPPTIPGR